MGAAMTLLDELDPARPTDLEPAEAPPPPEPANTDPHTPRRGVVGRLSDRLQQPESIITLVVVVVACVFTFVQLQPSKLFANTTPAGGDMGAHVWLPAYLRDHLLPHFRITGWTPDWYAGFPALLYYFPLPSLAIVLLNVVLPYNIAFKLISVSGLVALPLAAWAFGRLARMRFPGPACMAAATVPFLFSREFTIYGGNIASTLAGEFSFSISLAFALVFLGLVARGMQTGRGRALAAVVLLCAGLSHLLPTLFAVLGALVLTLVGDERGEWLGWPTRILGGLTVFTLLAHLVGVGPWALPLALAVLTLLAPALHIEGHRWRWTIPVFVVAGCLAAFWALPFAFRLPYATDMGYEKLTAYTKNLFPPHLLWLDVLAAIGMFTSVVRRHRIGTSLTILTVLSGLIFRFAPQARLWNARVLPFWFLCLYLLVGVAVAEGGTILVDLATAEERRDLHEWLQLGIPLGAIVVALIWVSYPLRILPFGHTDARTGQYSWLGVKTADRSFLPDWVRWNYSGYQSSGKAREAEYFDLVSIMTRLGKDPQYGCGRAMWEYESEEDQMGTPMALMLLPYWTHGCIGSMEGLYFESSATTPYHFLDAAELSLRPSNPVRGLNYPSAPDVNAGVAHLQMLGVKYYMALTPETQAQADVNPNLRLVATSQTFPVTYYTGNTSSVKQRTWKIYEIQVDSAIVAPLTNQPVVMKGVPTGGKGWLKPSEAWYLNPSLADVFYAASGPKDWARVAPMETSPPRTPLEPVQVSNIRSGDDNVSFDVDNVGVPVLVKVSYFPNWHVSGAKGPYRVTPNLMVVIPTSHHVRLHYGYTPVDIIGMILALVGIAGVIWMARAKPVRPPEPLHLRREGAFAWDGRADEDEELAGAYQRLEYELAGAFPSSRGDQVAGRTDDHLDLWLGFPAGLDLARYRTSEYQTGRFRPPAGNGAAGAAGSATVDAPGAAGNGRATEPEPETAAATEPEPETAAATGPEPVAPWEPDGSESHEPAGAAESGAVGTAPDGADAGGAVDTPQSATSGSAPENGHHAPTRAIADAPEGGGSPGS